MDSKWTKYVGKLTRERRIANGNWSTEKKKSSQNETQTHLNIKLSNVKDHSKDMGGPLADKSTDQHVLEEENLPLRNKLKKFENTYDESVKQVDEEYEKLINKNSISKRCEIEISLLNSKIDKLKFETEDLSSQIKSLSHINQLI